MKIFDVIIIGGGASGIMAALSATDHGADVLIVEKNNRIGKKILITGNGRCNYTNITLTGKDYNHPDFVNKIFDDFSFQETIDYFENLGIMAKIEGEGKVFPLSEQASSFLDVFLYELNIRKVVVETENEVISIIKKDNVFQINTNKNNNFFGKKVILSAGGKSMPGTGSDGSGYDLVKKYGHIITDVFPALVKVRLECPYLKQLSGVKINRQVDLLMHEEVLQSEQGDILFTNYGISGPTILELSRRINELILKNKKPEIRIKLIQSISKSRIIERFNNFQDKEISQSLIGLVNKRFINVLLKESSIEKGNILVSDVPKTNLFRLIDLLFDWRFKIINTLGFEDSQVTAGGIDLSNIDNCSLESKLVKGLYFTGELVDIDGKCGGYNLQWAWSSGYVAGKNASISAKND
ncbi:MAG: NAD(P)/FAD-dependent oxidoreductase [Candidatus Izemoplasmatales bacterium]